MRNHETSVCRILLLDTDLVDSAACRNAELQSLLLILIGMYQLCFKDLSMCCIISGLSKEAGDKILYLTFCKSSGYFYSRYIISGYDA